MASSPQTTKSIKLKRKATGRWSDEEHKIFLRGLQFRPSISWETISKMVKTRTARQTRTHAQKYFAKLKRHRNRKLATQMSSSSNASSDVTTTSEFDIHIDSGTYSQKPMAYNLPEYSALNADCIAALELFLDYDTENLDRNSKVLNFDPLYSF